MTKLQDSHQAIVQFLVDHHVLLLLLDFFSSSKSVGSIYRRNSGRPRRTFGGFFPSARYKWLVFDITIKQTSCCLFCDVSKTKSLTYLRHIVWDGLWVIFIIRWLIITFKEKLLISVILRPAALGDEP